MFDKVGLRHIGCGGSRSMDLILVIDPIERENFTNRRLKDV